MQKSKETMIRPFYISTLSPANRCSSYFTLISYFSFLPYELIICFAIRSDCFARRGSKGSLPVHIPSRAGYCGAAHTPPASRLIFLPVPDPLGARPCKVRTSSAIIFIQGRSCAPSNTPFLISYFLLLISHILHFTLYFLFCLASVKLFRRHLVFG